MRTLTLLLLATVGVGCMTSGTPEAPRSMAASGEAFLDDLQKRTFDWFWDWGNPENGLIPDRAPDPPFSSIAAVGFGLTGYGVGAERGFVTREQARDRTLATLEFLWNAPMGPDVFGTAGHRGFYYHFLTMDTGERRETTELSTIDTALLMGGVLFAREYFDREDPAESRIRMLADSLFLRVEWPWAQARPPLISMAWRPEAHPQSNPETGLSRHDYIGYNEAMILYVLALGSPTHPIGPEVWDAYTSTYQWADFYGYEHVNFSPLFGHQYSHVWIDYRDIQDDYMRERGIDYFENSRRATLAQREYAIANPRRFADYSADIWGWTACDGPGGVTIVHEGDSLRLRGYWARGVSARDIRDDGTITPTAAGGSIPFAPRETISALRTMIDRYGDRLYDEHGFVDSFNPTLRSHDIDPPRGSLHPDVGWFNRDKLGIDQGPILLMAENHRTGLVWEYMRRSPYIIRGLCRAGFTGGWLDGQCEDLN
jgi:hypothetical protein